MINIYFAIVAQTLNIEPSLIKSICWVESNHRNVINEYDGGSPSFGICQIKLKTANWMRKKNKISTKELTRSHLMKPLVNIYYAGLYIKYQIERYENDLDCAISAYNAGRCIKYNKKYVDKVKKRMLYYQKGEK